MGGGPSREEREAQRRAEERAREQSELQRQLIQAANVPDPLEERLRARDMAWLNWEDQTGPRDVRTAPGLGPALSLYDVAANEQASERKGIGALGLGLNSSNPMLAQLLESQSRDRRQQAAAGGLEDAVRMRSAEANRSALPLAQFAQDRRMGLAGLASGNANTATGQYLGFLSRPRQPSFWQQMLGGIIGGASGMGAAYLGRDRA